ncbi:hypothetical protein [Chondromyces crocatus]|uniref:Tetratricopeptide repeat protein n=1 Tax=Chondromyces crocatus TaxID=52 RepID=A0A0K1EJH1_CHOCO|nr:hypothetical protein [Chondromyces crocatus]AKT41009.1 uncharacterized protein CMC5_051670 [Chondromyces crocatus]
MESARGQTSRDRQTLREREGSRSAVRLVVPEDGAGADPIETLIRRSRRCRRRGDARRALVLLRDACNHDEWRARSWTILGAFLAELGRKDEAVSALEHAHWLRVRAGEARRAEVTARLTEQARRQAA